MNETNEVPTRRVFLAWNVSEADEMRGLITAWTSESEFGTHVCEGVPFKLAPMYDSYIYQS